ncbi:alcohol dehydrogenase catalytic domain-containing protein [Paenibacillus sp. HJL G12]|uniref:Alcohol dehydrogenase catalytic domain-containing protein n=1 Tax=Paenibacillus dendrobii TaxID=2691084 RepID=A0A7X3IG69_9BACL|nr:2,3-butanediol dehydrogenase [Paenibacillus dendrobii]MWV42851.1 alcohol dehydrogenase catalytic domain-containing protein [Paenibacillus dendrobii]
MKAAHIYGARDIRVENIEIPELQPGTVKVKVEFAGICGSDMHEYLAGIYPIRKQPVLGHEFSGVVTEVGEGVEGIMVGDKVAVEPLIPCGHCKNCKRGMSNLCTQSQGYGYSFSGGFAEYAVARAENVFVLPQNMSLELGALVEPTAVAVHAVRQSQLNLGDSVAILGAGPIGLLLLQAVKAAGAGRIFVVEVSEERRDKALELGATHVINPVTTDAVQLINEMTDGGVDVAYDAAGVQATFESGIMIVRPGGEFKIVSLWEKPVNFNPSIIVKTEAKISGSYAYNNLFPEVINLLASGAINGNAVITSMIALDDIVEKGFEQLTKDRKQCKILVNMSL